MMKINAGFLPLVDAAVLIVCRELGYSEKYGIDLVLSRETSWAYAGTPANCTKSRPLAAA
jgi:ABC-type nitrate/sulfonate/bicarbonate transport system substrate-binding protein